MKSDDGTRASRFFVNISESASTPGAFVFSFVPKGLQQVRDPRGAPSRVPRFVASVHRQNTGELIFDWGGSQDDPGPDREFMQAEIVDRLRDREAWINRVTQLVDQVERWAQDLGWATRRVDKRLDDSRIGRHHVPALLMQEGTSRVMLEPVGSSSPGTEGVVDLYLMPAYDDIATFYYYDDHWNLQHRVAADVANTRDGKGLPLSKDVLERTLADLRQHAA